MNWTADYIAETVFGSLCVTEKCWGYSFNGKTDIFKVASLEYAKRDAEDFYKTYLNKARQVPKFNVGRTKTMLGDVIISLTDGFWQCNFRNCVGVFEDLSEARSAVERMYSQTLE